MSILSAQHLTFSYAHSKSPALRDISCEFAPGSITAIAGANGAGKSTLAYALAGYIPNFFKGELQGHVLVDGLDTSKASLAGLVTKVGMVFQNPFNQISGSKLTVFEEVAFGLENLGVSRHEMKSRVEDALALFGLTNASDQSPFALSGGQQQRLALASIFVMETPIMVLDEPTSQLDPEATAQVMDTIKVLAQRGRTVILVEHKLEWIARLASRLLVLERGVLVADGEPRTLLARAGEWRLVETRYARAARLTQERGLLVPDIKLPQALEQAISVFSKQKSKIEP
jgi:energy-coupling factor transporter ATP-binding protein EcfA2